MTICMIAVSSRAWDNIKKSLFALDREADRPKRERHPSSAWRAGVFTGVRMSPRQLAFHQGISGQPRGSCTRCTTPSQLVSLTQPASPQDHIVGQESQVRVWRPLHHHRQTTALSHFTPLPGQGLKSLVGHCSFCFLMTMSVLCLEDLSLLQLST